MLDESVRFFTLDNVWMECLLDGALKTVDIHLATESLHFGFGRSFGRHTDFYKELKDIDTGKITSPVQTVGISRLVSKFTQLNTAPSCVVDIDALSANIKKSLNPSFFTSAQFALEMMEGVPRIRLKTPDYQATVRGVMVNEMVNLCQE